MRSRRIILTCTAFMAAFASFGNPRAVAQYRPVPLQNQEYHKPFQHLPGLSVTSNEVVHAPNFDNNPMCSDCDSCSGCQQRPLLRLNELYHERLTPLVWGPPLLSTLRDLSGVDRYQHHVYGGAEFFWWSTNSPSVQPLITSSVAGTSQEDAGVLGLGSTSVLFGGSELFDDQRPGGRYTGAFVLDGQERWIIEAVYTLIGDDEVFARGDALNSSIIGRPFFNTSISEEDASLAVFPGVADGRVDIDAITRFNTFQLALRKSLGRKFLGANTDYTIGYRRAKLNESVEIFNVTNSLSGPTAGTRFEVRDSFATRNDFDGIDFGMILQWQAGDRLSVDVLGKIALGQSQSTVRIDGRTITTPDGGDRTGVDGGLLAQPTNIGVFREAGFASMFEIGATLKYQFHKNVQGTVGYTFLSLTDIARVADQLDDSVNTSQFGGGVLDGDPSPVFQFSQGNFTASGLRVGVQILF